MTFLPLLYIKLKFISLYFNFSNIFLLISIPIILLLVINLLYYNYKDLKAKSTDLYQYKITSFYFTFMLIGLYIVLFIGVIYGLRIMYINKTLNLTVLFSRFYNLLMEFMLLPYMLQVYILILLILSFLFLLFIFANIQTLSFNEFFKLHIYLRVGEAHKDIFPFKYMYCKTVNNWGWISRDTPEIISGYIRSFISGIRFRSEKRYFKKITNVERIYYYFFKKHYRSIRHKEKILITLIDDIFFKVVYSKYYHRLFYISPILIILYDCYFNNWVLVHIFYYMIIYSPLVIIKRVTTCTHSINPYILDFFKTFYYENTPEHLNYMKAYASKVNKSLAWSTPHMVCIPKDFKVPMIDMYLLNSLRYDTHKFGVVAALDGSAEHDQMYMVNNSYFLRSDRNMYMSTGDVTILKKEDNKFYRFIYEHKLGEFELGEEWIVLEDKYNIEKPWTKIEYEKEEEIDTEELSAIIWNKFKEEREREAKLGIIRHKEPWEEAWEKSNEDREKELKIKQQEESKIKEPAANGNKN